LGKTSNKSKQAWNSGHYSQVKVSVRPEVAATFRAACEAGGVSMARVLSEYMEGYVASPPKKSAPALQTATRGKRRRSLEHLVADLVHIRDAEERYRDRIPENLSGSAAYEAADESISMLDEAIEILGSAYP
jgi:hypothetical protein